MSNIEFRESELLLMSKIKESSSNPRKSITDESVAELVESIKQVGIIQPVLVRETKAKNFNYEIVAGSRRFRACQILEWNHIPGIVVSGTKSEFQQIAIIENCQRMDMSPVEECHAYQELQKNGMNETEIADKIGKSIKYVYDRLSLDRLCDTATILLHEGKINITQGKVLCMVKKEDQEQMITKYSFRDGDEIIGMHPSNKIRDYIVSNVQQNLAAAIFDIKNEELTSAGSCLACPKRTGTDKLLFDGFDSDDICLDRSCFRTKKITFLDKIKSEYEENGKEVIRGTNLGWTEEDQEMEYEYSGNFQELTEEDQASGRKIEKLMIIYNGADTGKVVPILTSDQEIANRTEKNENSEEVKTENKAYHKAIELTIFKCAATQAKKNDNLMSLQVKKVLSWIIWAHSDIDTKRKVAKLMGWTIMEEEKALDHNDLNFNNEIKFFDTNYRGLDETETDQLISWLLFGNIPNIVVNNRLIFELADSLGINFEKDVLPEVNQEYGTELILNSFLNEQ